jgi:hypothetical protein
MGWTTPLPAPAERDASYVYGRHPGLGDYTSSRGSWGHRRATPDGRPLLVYGFGDGPSDADVVLWHELDERLPDLVTAAIASVPEPPVRPPWSLLSRRPVFSRDEHVLADVCLEGDGTFTLSFDSAYGDRIHLWPAVEFRDWTVSRSEWAA